MYLGISYSSTGNDCLNLSSVCSHKDGELVDNISNETESVVLCESLEQVLDCLVTTDRLGDLADNCGLVFGAQSRR